MRKNNVMNKKIIFILLFLGLYTCLPSKNCFVFADNISDDTSKKISQLLAGEHPLKAMATSQGGSSKGNGSGNLFFLFGSYSSESSSMNGLHVTFACQLNGESEYRFFNIPIQKVSIKIDNNIEKPTVKFGWSNAADNRKVCWTSYCHPEDINRYITRVIITCHENQWNPMIEIPLSKKKN